MVVPYASLCKLWWIWGSETPGECRGIGLDIPQLNIFFLHSLCLGFFFVI